VRGGRTQVLRHAYRYKNRIFVCREKMLCFSGCDCRRAKREIVLREPDAGERCGDRTSAGVKTTGGDCG